MFRALLIAGLVVASATATSAVAGVTQSRATPETGAGLDEDGPRVAGLRAADSGTDPRVSAVYPNPVADGDEGEFVVLRLPEGARPERLSISDGERTVALPNTTASGRIVVTDRTAVVRNLTAGPVVGLDSFPALANAGDEVVLRSNGTVVDRVEYRNATEGELGDRAGSGLDWRPLGATDFPVVHGGPGRARAFVLPDSPGIPVEVLDSADRRILLAGYTLASERVVAALERALDRGVEVRVLVEGGPVGGVTRRQATLLDRLAATNAGVRVMAGPRARYEFHHAKYAVVDNRSLVLTENWKPAGVGGRSSRGWGVVVNDSDVAAGLADVFAADAGWRDAVPWPRFREGRTFEPASPANGSYPARFESRSVPVANASLLVAPDNAEGRVVELIDGADESLRVLQASIGGRDDPFLRAAIRAARRGVEVRILLSGVWYAREENAALVAWLTDLAAEEGLPIEARLASPNGRFGKVHAKGLVIDGERVVLGSLNWNRHSARENREVVVVLEGRAVAGYYARVFDADWAGGRWQLPAGVLAAAVLVAVGVAASGRRIRFEDDPAGVAAG